MFVFAVGIWLLFFRAGEMAKIQKNKKRIMRYLVTPFWGGIKSLDMCRRMPAAIVESKKVSSHLVRISILFSLHSFACLCHSCATQLLNILARYSMILFHRVLQAGYAAQLVPTSCDPARRKCSPLCPTSRIVPQLAGNSPN